jgi:2-methylcitrate dehydratase PrpD
MSAVLFPALLALGQDRGTSGEDVIDAYVVGLEVAAGFGCTFNPGHRDRGWHATSTLGPLAAAAACGRLMRLDAATLVHAMNGAASFAGGTMAQFGSMMKATHAGAAAADGITAAAFAAAGVTASAEAIEGRFGMTALMDGSHDRATAPDFNRLAIVTDGLKVKPYPTCASAHRAIDGVLALRTRHGLAASDIESIVVRAPASHLANMMHPHPTDTREARFSLPFCLAVAAARANLALADLSPATLSDPEIKRLMASVSATPVDASEREFATQVTVALKSGARFTTEIDAPRGRSDNPLTESELWRKYTDCCDTAVSPARRDEIAAALRAFDSRRPAATLMDAVCR